MGVASHLGITLSQYDRMIRTFIPHYTEIVDAAADVVAIVAPVAPRVVDLGTGSGALASRVLARRPRARVMGIDADEGMLALATRRLGRRWTGVLGNFERTDLPACDAITASFALHHIPTRSRKAALYRRAYRALRHGGVFVNADCQLATDRELQRVHRARWIAHLRRTYSPAKSESFLRAWAREDVYTTLDDELRLGTRAGFEVDLVWRQDGFAVIVARKR